MSSNYELVLFGRMTASISHEINNVMAIVNELAGLQNDLLLGIEEGMDVDPQRFATISEDIQKQIQRGEGIVKRLNRSAHSLDAPVSEFDLAVVLDDTVTIAQRLASVKGVTLNLHPSDGPLSIMSSRFIVQQALFAYLELAFNSLESGSTVEIECRKQESRVDVYLTGDAPIQTDGQKDRLSDLLQLAYTIQGKVEHPSDNNRLSMVFSFPSTISEIGE